MHRRSGFIVVVAAALVVLAACQREDETRMEQTPAQGKAEEMASGGALSFFVDEQDARTLLGRLNADPELAFIVPNGPRIPPPNEQMPVSPSMGDRRPTR